MRIANGFQLLSFLNAISAFCGRNIRSTSKYSMIMAFMVENAKAVEFASNSLKTCHCLVLVSYFLITTFKAILNF